MTARAGLRPASSQSRTPTARWLAMLQDALLVVISGLFVWVHVTRVADGRIASIPFAIEQALLVGMFLTRRRSMATSNRPFEWIVAAGSWLPLMMRPDEGGDTSVAIGLGLQMGGLLMTFAGFLSLGRSFGVVAANRGLKVHGAYRIIRHPIYFSHLVTTTGFVIANPSPWNGGLFVVVTICQLLRIRAEERVLGETAEYATYRAKVRWRLIPFVY